jgi:hypothetical protein
MTYLILLTRLPAEQSFNFELFVEYHDSPSPVAGRNSAAGRVKNTKLNNLRTEQFCLHLLLSSSFAQSEEEKKTNFISTLRVSSRFLWHYEQDL